MSLKTSWRSWRRGRAAQKAVRDIPSKRPLREFVYLDEVSLRSLLVSQRDTIPEAETRAISLAEEAEASGKVMVGNELVGKGELGSRFKTSNSNSVQTSRKAIAQSLFNELRSAKNVDYAIVVTSNSPDPLPNVSALGRSNNATAVIPASALQRGALVELEVVLKVDPVFKLNTLFSEFTAMVDENKGMFGANAQAMLHDMAPVNRMLQRLLAGLIPIRAVANNFSVVAWAGEEFVVHDSALGQLPMARRSLEVVGVTEHLSYWKDIRRVLFSESRVTLLGRVARDGLHESWTPVKLADLFREAVPTLVDQINEASHTGVGGLTAASREVEDQALPLALNIYKHKLQEVGGIELDELESAQLALALEKVSSDAQSPAAQKVAFELVRKAVEDKAGTSIFNSNAHLAARKEARTAAGLETLPGVEQPSAGASTEPIRYNTADDRLLDVEIVAIYW
jgi:hypothetical protein